AELVRVVLRDRPGVDDGAAVDDAADRLGQAVGARVTVIAADGRVLGDSELDGAALARVDNHGRRHEVLAAMRETRGTSRRHSTTIGKDLLYVAVSLGEPSRAVVRVATALDDVEEAVGRLRLMLLIGGLLGVLAAAFMSGFASELMSRALRDLVDHARVLNREGGRRISISSSDEIGRLAGSFNRLAEQL